MLVDCSLLQAMKTSYKHRHSQGTHCMAVAPNNPRLSEPVLPIYPSDFGGYLQYDCHLGSNDIENIELSIPAILHCQFILQTDCHI